MKRCMGCMAEMSEEESVCSICGYKEGTDVKEAYYLLPGKMIGGKYMVGRVLGYGGFGVTYIGWDTKLGRRVAIKEYLPSDFATRSYGTVQLTVYSGEATVQFESGLKSFISEARRLAKFNHIPEIVDIYDCFMENDTGYIIMEFLEGEDVKTILKKKGKIPVDEATDITMHVLHGLAEVHKEGIVHRDIAPDNIYITKNGDVKLLDFGASRYATAVQSRSLSVILKPGYAPEEQYRSRGKQGPWTDVYAMAATFYRMLTGRRPKEAIERLANDDLAKPSELGVDVPENVETALMNALNVRQEFRTKDAETFYDELKSSRVERVIEENTVEKRRLPIWGKCVIGAASVAIAASIGVFAASQAGVFDKKIPQSVRASLAADECYVPDVSNMSYDEAESMLSNMDIKVKINGINYSEQIELNRILNQEPESGAVIKQKETVYVVMSGGTELVMVPDLSGMGQEEAAALIDVQKLKLDPDKIQEEYSDTVAKGNIISQTLAADEQVGVNTEICFTVSKGKKSDAVADLIVPDLKGMTYDEAIECLEQLQQAEKFTFAIGESKKKYSDKVEKGCIISQSLKAGTVVSTDQPIDIVISKGPKTVSVPNVQYQQQAAAVAALEALGLKVKVQEEYSSSVAKGLVISQSSSPNSEVKKGKTITITVSLGEKTTQKNDSGSNNNSNNNNNNSSDSKKPTNENPSGGMKFDEDDDIKFDEDDDIKFN